MKRSQINAAIRWAIDFCEEHQFKLPLWAYWKPARWARVGKETDEIRQRMLGWDVTDYRGAKIIWHGGAVFGFQTAVVLLPEKKVGFAITINSEDGVIVRGLMNELLDHYLGLPKEDWPAKFVSFKSNQINKALEIVKATQSTPAKVGPSVPTAQMAGTYADPWYGNIEVAATPAGLTIDFKSAPRMGGKLEHWQYDTYITRFDDKTLEPAYVTFALDKDGKVANVTMKAASPVADFSWDYHDLSFTPVKGKK